jgi:hypothetical protein
MYMPWLSGATDRGCTELFSFVVVWSSGPCSTPNSLIYAKGTFLFPSSIYRIFLENAMLLN